jgi:hypothetical protein
VVGLFDEAVWVNPRGTWPYTVTASVPFKNGRTPSKKAEIMVGRDKEGEGTRTLGCHIF